MNYRSTLCLVAGAILLSACGDDAPPEETEAEAGRGAKGEVLGGTISDAMIPLDQLRSQSPPMPESPSRSREETAAEACESTEPGIDPETDAASASIEPDEATEPAED